MRKAVLVLASVSSVLAAAILVAILFLPDWTKYRLAKNGLGNVDFTVERISLDRLVLSDIRFGLNQEQRLERVVVVFRPIGLLAGSPLERISIEGADLHVIPGDDGIPSLAGVPLFNAPRTGADLGVAAIPVRTFDLRASQLNLETGMGTLRLLLTGSLMHTDAGAWMLGAETILDQEQARAELTLTGRLETNGEARLHADLSRTELALPGKPEIAVEGNVTLARDRAGRLLANGRLALQLAESMVNLEVKAEGADGADSSLALALKLDATQISVAELDKLFALGSGLDGRASVQARLEAVSPFQSARRLQETRAGGRISLEIEDGTLPGFLTETSIKVAADLSLSENSLLAAPAGPWELAGRLVGPGPPAVLRVTNADTEGLVLRSSLDLARQSATGTIGFTLTDLNGHEIAGTGFGHILRTPGEEIRFDLDRLQLDPAHWMLDGLDVRLKELDAQLTGTASQLVGRIAAALDISGELPGDNRLSGGEISLQGDLSYAGGVLAFKAEDCVSIKANRMNLGAIRWLRPVELCAVQREGRPLLRYDRQGTASLNLIVPSHPVVLSVGRGQSPIKLAGTMPDASLSATLDPKTAKHTVKVETRGGRLELTEQSVAISDIEMSLFQDQSISATLKHAVAKSFATPPDFPILALEGTAGGSFDGTMVFQIEARGRDVPLKLSVKGEHNFALAIGELSYAVDEIRFTPEGLQPDAILPAVDKLVDKAQGAVSLRGDLSWIAGVPAMQLRLALRDLGFDAPGLRVRGINTRLERTGLKIPNKRATQEIRVELLDAGLPLRDGLIRYNTRRAPTVQIEKVRFAWGGGLLQTAPFDIRLDKLSAEHSLVLTSSDIQLSALLDLIPIEGLQGTGRLNGRLPLRLRGEEVMVDQGLINAQAPGVLRYRPDNKPAFFEKNSETELLFKALQNFHYDSLAIGLNGKTRDDLQLTISLAGSNPDLYDGHPFKLNFNISGEIDTIIQRSLSIAKFAERFGDLMPSYLQ